MFWYQVYRRQKPQTSEHMYCFASVTETSSKEKKKQTSRMLPFFFLSDIIGTYWLLINTLVVKKIQRTS